MPIYEYRCEACGHEFEKLVRPTQDEPSTCVECDEAAIERLVSNTTFQLKGSGWYETDYADNDSEPETQAPDDDADDDADDGATDEAEVA